MASLLAPGLEFHMTPYVQVPVSGLPNSSVTGSPSAPLRTPTRLTPGASRHVTADLLASTPNRSRPNQSHTIPATWS